MINEGFEVEFRAEFFNVLNKTNFGAPSGTATGLVFDAAGRVTATGALGRFAARFQPVNLQFALDT